MFSLPTSVSNRLTRHLRENNQTYCQHLCDAWGYSFQCFSSAAVFLVHGLLPFTFEHTGSELINNVHDVIAAKQAATAAVNSSDDVEESQY